MLIQFSHRESRYLYSQPDYHLKPNPIPKKVHEGKEKENDIWNKLLWPN